MGRGISKELTVLFADVAGSVELYSELGDLEAHSRISQFLQSMASLIERHQGQVIETIGDEVMCAFDMANNALTAACAIQEHIRRERKLGLNVRVGFHSGMTSMHDGHPFGDTVNVAARVVALSKAGQIMLTDHVHQRLSNANKSRTRYFNEVHIKGKCIPYMIHQALWDQEDGTIMFQSNITKPVRRRHQLNLRYRDTEATITEGLELILGRGEQCDLIVNSEGASRIHSIVKCQGGKLVLTDRSTNGTFVKSLSGESDSDDSELFFHHDGWVTTSNGIISLGKPITSDNDSLIHFSWS